MKRDMAFVRELLLAIEAAPEDSIDLVDLLKTKGVEDQGKVLFHLALLHNAHLILGLHSEYVGGGQDWHSLKLTWSGHEFIETIRDSEVWQLTKDGAKKAGNFGLDFVVQLAKAYGKHVAKERLGLHVSADVR